MFQRQIIHVLYLRQRSISSYLDIYTFFGISSSVPSYVERRTFRFNARGAEVRRSTSTFWDVRVPCCCCAMWYWSGRILFSSFISTVYYLRRHDFRFYDISITTSASMASMDTKTVWNCSLAIKQQFQHYFHSFKMSYQFLPHIFHSRTKIRQTANQCFKK